MMKVLYRTVFCLTALSSMTAYAQDDISNIVKGSLKDANYIANGYFSPALKALATGINAGWVNTAKPHKTLGMDLTITVSPVSIPTSDLLYEVDNTKLSNVTLQKTHTGQFVTNGKGQVPTIFGPESSPTYYYNLPNSDLPDPSYVDPTFKGPQGIDLKKNLGIQSIPIPMAHLGIGIYKGTDVKLRFIPSTKLGTDGNISMFGIGVLHDVKQWIPGIKNLPFDLSGFVGYTKFKVGLELDEPGQTADFDVTATTIQGLISKKFSVLTLYGGLGYNIGKSSLAIKGNYDLDDNGSYETKDPLALSATASGPRATAGLRLKLAIFTFHGDYTIQKYKTLSVGFGLAFR